MPLWNPSSSDNDLKFWVRGNGQRTVSGTDIIALYDESGNNTHLNVVGTDANDTDPQTGEFINNIPAWKFTPHSGGAEGSCLFADASANILESGVNDLQDTIVCKHGTTSGTDCLMAEFVFGNAITILRRSSDIRVTTPDGNLEFGSVTTNTTIIQLEYDDTETDLIGYQDAPNSGTTKANIEDISGADNRQFVLGREGSPDGSNSNRAYDGLIAEIIVYHGSPNMTFDRELNEGYVAHKYNVTVTGSTHAYKDGPPTACHCVAKQTLSTTLLSASVKNPADLQQGLNVFDERR